MRVPGPAVKVGESIAKEIRRFGLLVLEIWRSQISPGKLRRICVYLYFDKFFRKQQITTVTSVYKTETGTTTPRTTNGHNYNHQNETTNYIKERPRDGRCLLGHKLLFLPHSTFLFF